MKKSFILIVICLIFISNLFAQNDSTKMLVSVQYGYMGDLTEYLNPGFNTWIYLPPNFSPIQSNINPASYGKIRNGSFLSFDIEKKLKKKGYSLGLSFIKGEASFKMNDKDSLFWNKDAKENYMIITLFFNKEFTLNRKNSLIFGFGLSTLGYERITIDENQSFNTNYIDYRTYSSVDLGFLLNLQYLYQLQKNLSIGIQIKSLHSTINFWEAIMIAPTLRFKVY